MTTFRFITVGENLGTRKLGEETRNKLLPLLLGEGQVVLDFEGVNVVSNSFADECLAKLLLIMPLEELKKKTTFRGLNDFARKNISVRPRKPAGSRRIFSSSSRSCDMARMIKGRNKKLLKRIYRFFENILEILRPVGSEINTYDIFTWIDV